MAGSPLLTPALILGSLSYGETSRIVRLATYDHGVLSAIAKGALRPKSRFGASLRLLSEGTAHLILSPTRELHLLTAFDTTDTHTELARDVSRFLAASAMAELAVRFVPPGPNPAVYTHMVAGLHDLEHADPSTTPVEGLRLLWLLVNELGFAPSISWCAKEGTAIGVGDGAAFSLEEGGLLCAKCADAMHASTRLAAGDVAALTAMLDPRGLLPELSAAHLAAHRRLLVRWVRYHLSEGSLPALELWQRGVSA